VQNPDRFRCGDLAVFKHLTAVPIYNEETHIESVLREIWRYCREILVVNDGSTDRSGEILARLARETAVQAERAGGSGNRLTVISHSRNQGYGAALISAFSYAKEQEIDVLVTMDCDGQHEPARIPVLLEAIHDADIVSGSRYLRLFRHDTPPPADRMEINRIITEELNKRFGLHLTDAFCGFKAYRRSALGKLHITETGWGMPLQLWVQAARLGLRIKEVAVPRLYLDPNRAFGGVLDNAEERLAYYRRVIAEAARDEGIEQTYPCCPFSSSPSEESCR
jgi:glycosyltransferase involved in cell wall biosynthesis